MVKRSKGIRSKSRQILRKKPRNKGLKSITRALQEFEIGENAGLIWRFLYNEGDFHINGLLSKLKINEKDIYSAVGWLARENKIKIKKDIYKIL